MGMINISLNRTESLTMITEVLGLIRKKVDPTMQVQTIFLFIHTAIFKETTMRELGEITGLSPASMSRNIAALSKQHRVGKAGHDLLVTSEDPAERRVKRVKLTAKGKKLADEITKVIGAYC